MVRWLQYFETQIGERSGVPRIKDTALSARTILFRK